MPAFLIIMLVLHGTRLSRDEILAKMRELDLFDEDNDFDYEMHALEEGKYIKYGASSTLGVTDGKVMVTPLSPAWSLTDEGKKVIEGHKLLRYIQDKMPEFVALPQDADKFPSKVS